MAHDPRYQQPTERCNTSQATNRRYEEIGAVNSGAIEMNPQNTPSFKSKNIDNLSNKDISTCESTSPPRRGNCWCTVATIIFMIVSLTSLALNILVIKGVIITPGQRGAPGTPGRHGEPGHAGSPGTPGLQGPPGSHGEPGHAGSPGTPGLQGSTGLHGAPGHAGPAGPKGPLGLKGKQGDQGLQGPVGPNGTKGIPGPAGAGNMSLCTFHTQKSTGVTAGNSAATDVIIAEPAGRRILGVICSTNNAAVTAFETTINKNKKFFKCICKGSTPLLNKPGSHLMYCYINYWSCPLVT